MDGQNVHKCTVSKKGAKFHLTLNDKDSLTIDDSFTLFDEVIETQVGDNKKLTLQLISKEAGGHIGLQYLGTKVNNPYLA